MADGGKGETVGKELTAKQRRNKKKKEAAKRKKQEQILKESGKATGGNKVKTDEEGAQATETPEEKFNRELNWCIIQLEMGLAFQKPDKKQAEVTYRHLRSLKSTKTPLPRKRQIMYSLFGDYRKKMQDDQKHKQEPLVNPKLSCVKQEDQRSIFVKVCQRKSTDPERQKYTEKDVALSDHWTFQNSDNNFRFNFAASEEPP